MSIVAGEIITYLSGGVANSNPNLALGGAISSTAITDNTLNNLFSDVTGDMHATGYTTYRCFYVKNTNASLSAYNSKVWIQTNTSGTDETITIAIEGAKGSPVQTIGTETTAPSSPTLTFYTANSQGNALNLGTLATNDVYAIWVKRVVTIGTQPYASDSAVIKFYVDTL